MFYRNMLFSLALICLFLGSLFSQEKSNKLQIQKIPTTLKEFKVMYKELAGTPRGAATCFVIALKIHTTNSELGKQCLVRCINNKVLNKTDDGWKLRKGNARLIKDQLKQHPYLPDSYFVGSNPANGYQAKAPYYLKFKKKPTRKELQEGRFRLFVKSFGADSARPLTLVQTKSRKTWKIHEWSSLIVGIRAPETTEEEDEDYF